MSSSKEIRRIVKALVTLYVTQFTQRNILPIWILDDSAFGTITGIFNSEWKNENYKIYVAVINGLSQLNITWLTYKNILAIRRRCRKHFLKYRRYLGQFASAISSTTSGRTSILIESKGPTKLKNVDILKRLDKYELFDGKIYRTKQDVDENLFEVYTVKDFGNLPPSDFQFTTGMGAIVWQTVSSQIRYGNKLNWLAAFESLLTTEIVDLDNVQIEKQSKWNAIDAKLIVIFKGNQNIYKIKLAVSQTFVKSVDQIVKSKWSGVEIMKHQDKLQILRFGRVIGHASELDAETFMKQLVMNTINMTQFGIMLDSEAMIKLQNIEYCTYTIPTLVQSKLKRIQESLSQEISIPKMIISAGKGSGKTSLIKHLDARDGFIIDSDEWGEWLYFFMLSHKIVDLKQLAIIEITDDEIFESVSIWKEEREFYLGKSCFAEIARAIILGYDPGRNVGENVCKFIRFIYITVH